MTDENLPPGAPGATESAPDAASPELDAPKQPSSELARALPTPGVSPAAPQRPSFWFLAVVSAVCLAASPSVALADGDE